MARNLFEHHPVLGYRFIPGIRARVRHEGGGYLIRCNQSGFRCDHEVTPAKPEGVFRVVLCGDSYTAGEGVSNAFRFGDLLEHRFERTQVLNFGLPGSGTDQQLLAFREFAADIEYDLLVICPLVENIRRNVETHRLTQGAADGKLVRRAKPYFTLEHDGLELHHQPVPKSVVPEDQLPEIPPEERVSGMYGALQRMNTAIDRRVPGFKGLTTRLRRIDLPEEYADPEHEAWRLMRAILTDWVDESRSDVMICPLPTFGHVDKHFLGDNYRRRFRELSDELSVEVIDVLPAFWKHAADFRRRCRFPDDEHPTRLGHTVIADALEPHVRRFHERWRASHGAAVR